MSDDTLVSEQELLIAKNRSQGSIKAKAHYFDLKKRFDNQNSRLDVTTGSKLTASNKDSRQGKAKNHPRLSFKSFTQSQGGKTKTLLSFINFTTSFDIQSSIPNMEGLKERLRRIGIVGDESDEHLRSKILSLQGQYAIQNFIIQGRLTESEIDEVDDFLETLGLSHLYTRSNHIARGAIRRHRVSLELQPDRDELNSSSTRERPSDESSSNSTPAGQDHASEADPSRSSQSDFTDSGNPGQQQRQTQQEEHPASMDDTTHDSNEQNQGDTPWDQFLRGKSSDFQRSAEYWYSTLRNVELANNRLSSEVRDRWTAAAAGEYGRELLTAIVNRFDLDEDSINPNSIDYLPINSSNISKFQMNGVRSSHSRATIQPLLSSYHALKHSWLETPHPTDGSTRRKRIHKIRELQFRIDYLEHSDITNDHYYG